MKSASAVIVGGGVIGLSAAFHLARKGAGRITILEKGKIGDGSSRRAAGITTGLLWTETGVSARKIGLRLFREMSEELDGYSYHGEEGCLNLFSPDLWPAREQLLPLYDRLDMPYEVLDAAEVGYRWPVLNLPEDMIGLHDPQGGYSEAEEYIEALARRIRLMGVEIIEGETVVEFCRQGRRITGVRTQRRIVEADAVVSTVHVWGLALWAHLDFRLPMKSFVHQRYLSRPQPVPLLCPPVNSGSHYGYFRPAAGNRVLLGVETPDRDESPVRSLDFHMSQLSTPLEVRDRGVRSFQSLLPLISQLEWEAESVGLLSFSMDAEPIVGAVQEFAGLYVAASFHSGGFSYNTIAGLLLAELVMEGRTSIDISAFSPNRFVAGEVDRFLSEKVTQAAVVNRRH